MCPKRCQDKQCNTWSSAAQPGAHLVSIGTGKHQVDERHVELLRGEESQCHFAVKGHSHIEELVDETRADDFRKVCIVLDDEHPSQPPTVRVG